MDREKEQEQHKAQCDKYVEKSLRRDMTVRFLLEKLVGLGCTPPPGFIRCVDCGDKQAGGGFGMVQETLLNNSNSNNHHQDQEEAQRRVSLPQCQRTVADLQKQLQAEADGTSKLELVPEIFLCQQHLRNESHARQSIAHELIHAIDMCRTKMDPLHNCIHLACTEIRAENLSGECGWIQEMGAGRVQKFAQHGQACVKRRAILSVKANPHCRDKAQDYVDAAMERCFEDTYPFDRHPNLR